MCGSGINCDVQVILEDDLTYTTESSLEIVPTHEAANHL
jgi:hypothetical protein